MVCFSASAEHWNHWGAFNIPKAQAAPRATKTFRKIVTFDYLGFSPFPAIITISWFHSDLRMLSILYLCGQPSSWIKILLVQKNCWNISTLLEPVAVIWNVELKCDAFALAVLQLLPITSTIYTVISLNFLKVRATLLSLQECFSKVLANSTLSD